MNNQLNVINLAKPKSIADYYLLVSFCFLFSLFFQVKANGRRYSMKDSTSLRPTLIFQILKPNIRKSIILTQHSPKKINKVIHYINITEKVTNFKTKLTFENEIQLHQNYTSLN